MCNNKKWFFGLILCIFSIFPSFGQEIIWTTISGSGIRTIQMNSVRQEVMRMYDQYNWFFFERGEDGDFFMPRSERKEVINDLLNYSSRDPRADRNLQQYRRQVISWMDNNRNFVFHSRMNEMVAVTRGGRTSFVEEYAYRIVFVIGDTVMEVTFTNTEPRNGFETKYGNNRNIFLDNMNWLLSNL